MKTLINLTSGIFLLFLSTCNNVSQSGVKLTGTIAEQGITSYQYGSHTITTSDNFYAIKSDSLDLNQYLNQEVTVRAFKIDGYPVDGGPEYYHVVEVD